jgi:hypothetical protein
VCINKKTHRGGGVVPGEEDDMDEDDKEIWEVTHVSEEELETTEGEGVDFLTELLEVVGWPQVNDEKTEKDLS